MNKVKELLESNKGLLTDEEVKSAMKISEASTVAHDALLRFLEKKVSDRLQLEIDKK